MSLSNNIQNDTILIGISGPTCSGKTTLARVLSNILLFAGQETVVLHLDDFYKPDAEIPWVFHEGVEGNKVQDWDCAEALDFKRLNNVIRDFRDGKPLTAAPRDEDLPPNDVESLLDAKETDDWARTFRDLLGPSKKVCILEGFLLYGRGIEDRICWRARPFDGRLLMKVDFETAERRRLARGAYPTTDGATWVDPPGYFEKVAWPNYLRYSSGLFGSAGVEGYMPWDMEILPIGDGQNKRAACLWGLRCMERIIMRVAGNTNGERTGRLRAQCGA